MNKKTLTALKGSIHKWEKIVAGTGIDYGPTNCPLCKMFLGDWRNRNPATDCKGCPVREASGESYCEDTPYDKYTEVGGIKHAKAELKFLKSLLPKTPAKPRRARRKSLASSRS